MENDREFDLKYTQLFLDDDIIEHSNRLQLVWLNCGLMDFARSEPIDFKEIWLQSLLCGLEESCN